MSGRAIDHATPSSQQYSAEKLYKHESIDECHNEDRFRGHNLLRAGDRFPNIVDPALALNLALRLGRSMSQIEGAETLASRAYMRQLRFNVCAAIWELMDKANGSSVCAFTIIPATWEIPAGELLHKSASRFMSALRTALYDLGAAKADGWFIAFLHGEYDPVAKVYRLHVHGFACGEMTKVIDRLRKLPNYETRMFLPDGSLNPVYRRVRVTRAALSRLPYPITYGLQSYWPSRAVIISDDGTRIRQRSKGRIPEPYHSEVLLWLDKWRLADLTLMIGLRVTIDGLKQTKPVS